MPKRDAFPLAGTRPKIFLIGFNRCGTQSFHSFFMQNGIRSAHWLKGKLATRLHQARKVDADPISRLKRYDAYSDFFARLPNNIIDANLHFEHLWRWYPDAYFILNTRQVGAWIDSRIDHREGLYERYYADANQQIDDIAARLEHRWHNHHQRVRKFFRENPEARFLEFHIGRDATTSLCDFLAADYAIEKMEFPHLGKRPKL